MGRAWLFAIAASTGCVQQTTSFDVVDTSGAPFRWTCGEHCIPEPTDVTPPLDSCWSGTRAAYTWAFDRFIMISSACVDPDGSWGSSANRERPLACDTAEDCPQFTGAYGTFECLDRVCQNADVERFPPGSIDWATAETLCFAPIPREDSFELAGDASQRVSDTTTAACHGTVGPCDPLPDTCLQL
jgi:hypothetical protein